MLLRLWPLSAGEVPRLKTREYFFLWPGKANRFRFSGCREAWTNFHRPTACQEKERRWQNEPGNLYGSPNKSRNRRPFENALLYRTRGRRRSATERSIS